MTLRATVYYSSPEMVEMHISPYSMRFVFESEDELDSRALSWIARLLSVSPSRLSFSSGAETAGLLVDGETPYGEVTFSFDGDYACLRQALEIGQ